jgi:diguanylate cyclase (GGDEF)-like protein
VFSGAYNVGSTPLQAYVDSLVSLRGSRFFLIDDTGVVLTSSGPTRARQTLTGVDPDLAAAYRTHRSGRYADHFFTSEPVPGTTWTVLATISSGSLLAPVQGSGELLAWAILVAFSAAAIFVWFLVIRRGQDHVRLQEAFERADRLTRVDGLTGVHNRRSTVEQLALAHERAVRDGTWLSVLMVDVDHFKRINDAFGHLAGDDALVAVVDKLQCAIRDSDVLGRWGGEEFVVVLPETDAGAAMQVAERLRAAVSADLIDLGVDGETIHVTVSVGVSSSVEAIPDVLVHAADRALYLAKADGRDRIRQLRPSIAPILPVPDRPTFARIVAPRAAGTTA